MPPVFSMMIFIAQSFVVDIISLSVINIYMADVNEFGQVLAAVFL